MLGYIISDKEEINVIEHEIQSFDVLHKTDLNIFVIENGVVLYKNDIIMNASKYGHVQVLEWYKRSGYEFKHGESAITWAACKGHIHILEWFKHSGYKFKYNKWAVSDASYNGHVQVLEWFKHSGYEFKYNTRAFGWALKKKHVRVLEWFKRSGYKLKYDRWEMQRAGNFIVLKFLIENINPKKVIKWSKNAYVKTLKFKTKKRYFKGHKKN